MIRPVPGLNELVGGAGAVSTATRAMALDLAPVRVNCLAFGLILTEMWDVGLLTCLSYIPATSIHYNL